jgi:hypothetical protein
MGLHPVRELLADAWRQVVLCWWQWAAREIPPLHDDVPEVVHRLAELQRDQKPARPRSRCERTWGCAQDHECPDTQCPGFPADGPIAPLHQGDGGIEFRGGVAWVIEARNEGATA